MKKQYSIYPPSYLYGERKTFTTPALFKDANLKAAVEERIGPNPTPTEMQNLRYFYPSEKNIEDLTGLEYATNLRELSLGLNNITDLTPLANLTMMGMLYLSQNEIVDLGPLRNLTNLEELYLDFNSIIDLEPLANLTKLNHLELHSNKIENVEPLANLNKLERLGLRDNKISDLKPLTDMTHLENLEIGGNPLNIWFYLSWYYIIKENNPNLSVHFYAGIFNGSIMVKNPNGGETLLGGRKYNICWESERLGEVNISFSLDNGQSWTLIDTDTSPNGENKYSWIVPEVSEMFDQCLVRIEMPEYPNVSAEVNDTSDGVFTIVPCGVSVEDGDLNDDCKVDLGDFAVMAENWLNTN